VVKICDYFEDLSDGLAHLVLESAGEMSLQDLISKSKLVSHEAKSVTRQLLEAVSYLNSQGICHRDLNPDKIRVNVVEDRINNTRKLFVKVIDFNVSF
jgi:serine/threonine protein kinase